MCRPPPPPPAAPTGRPPPPPAPQVPDYAHLYKVLTEALLEYNETNAGARAETRVRESARGSTALSGARPWRAAGPPHARKACGTNHNRVAAVARGNQHNQIIDTINIQPPKPQ